MTTEVGSVPWTAPELLVARGKRNVVEYGASIDVYAYGVVLWELVSHKKPWEGVRPMGDETTDAILRALRGERPSFSHQMDMMMPDSYFELMRMLGR